MPSQEPTAKPPGIQFYGGYQVYSDTGIDLTLLRANLQRDFEDRIQNNTGALRGVRELEESGRRTYPWAFANKVPVTMLDVEPILRQLVDHQVEFVLIGGLAMRLHGSAHITEAMDICYSRTPRNLVALAAALAPLHPYLRGVPPGLPFRFDVPTIQAGLNFTLTTDRGPLDLLGEMEGIGGYDQVLLQSVERALFGMTLRVLSLDGLITAKRVAGRPKDRNHLLELEELKKLRDAAQGG